MRATTPKALIKTLSRPCSTALKPAPEEELAEAELELALPIEAPDVVTELSLLAVLEGDSVAEDPDVVCVAIEEPEPVIEA